MRKRSVTSLSIVLVLCSLLLASAHCARQVAGPPRGATTLKIQYPNSTPSGRAPGSLAQYSFIDTIWVSVFLGSDESMENPLFRMPVRIVEAQKEMKVDLTLPAAPAYRLHLEAVGGREREGRTSPTLYGVQFIGDKALDLDDLQSGPVEVQLTDAVPFPSVQRRLENDETVDRISWPAVPGARAFAVRDTSQVLDADVPSTQYAITGGTGIGYRVCALFPGGLRSAFSEPLYLSAREPFLASTMPGTVVPGQGILDLALSGSGFQRGATTLWDELRLPTDYEASTIIGAHVPPERTSTPGLVHIRVENPDGQVSNAIEFPVAVVAPMISEVLPDPVPAGLINGVTLTITGTSFEFGSVVTWNGADLNTKFGSSTQLSPFVPRDLIASEGTATLQVRNPNGQRSNTWNVFIRGL